MFIVSSSLAEMNVVSYRLSSTHHTVCEKRENGTHQVRGRSCTHRMCSGGGQCAVVEVSVQWWRLVCSGGGQCAVVEVSVQGCRLVYTCASVS